jgi:hypothetical protein
MKRTPVNPFYALRYRKPPSPTSPTRYVKLPCAPVTASPVPHLTSLYHLDDQGDCRNRRYPGNCGGNLIKDLLQYFTPGSVIDPMTGSGTCRAVCQVLGLECWSSDLHQNVDACDARQLPRERFEFAWIHLPYWRQKLYCNDPRDLSRTHSLEAFLYRYRLLIENCAGALVAGGKLAILMGDYCDREAGFVPLVYHTKQLAFDCGLRQHCTDIIRFSHGTKQQPEGVSFLIHSRPP